jgi:hypothetical protein
MAHCEIVVCDDPALNGKDGEDGKRGKLGNAEVTVTFGAPRFMDLGAQIVVPVDPIYLAFDGNAVEGTGLPIASTDSKAPYTYIAQNKSNRLDIGASIGGNMLGAPVALVVTVYSSTEVLLKTIDTITVFEPFSTFSGVELKVKPGNLVRISAGPGPGLTLSQLQYSGITVRARFWSKA